MSNNIYKDMMNQTVISDKLAQNIRNEMLSVIKAREAKSRSGQQIRRFRLLLVTAILVTLIATVAFAQSEIRQFFFGNSNITQVEEIENVFGISGTLIREVKIINGKYESVDWSLNFEGWSEFYTVAELRHAAAFDIKEPGYLPDTIDLSSISTFGAWYTSEKQIEFVFIEYGGGSPSGTGIVSLSQWYVGSDASFEIVTIYPIEKVMVGDVEASVIIETFEDDTERAILYWKQGSVLYELQHTAFDGVDMDILIAIAESV